MRRGGRAYVFVCAYARHDCVRMPFVSVHVCIITYVCALFTYAYRVCMWRVNNMSLKGFS